MIVKKKFSQITFTGGGSSDAQTATNLSNTHTGVHGTLLRVDVIVSAVSEAITVTAAITDTDNSGSYFSKAGCADGAQTIALARSNKGTPDADFNEVPLCGNNLTLTVTPSAVDANEDMTVDVYIYLEV